MKLYNFCISLHSTINHGKLAGHIVIVNHPYYTTNYLGVKKVSLK